MKYILFTGATGGLGQLCVKHFSSTKEWIIFAAGTNQSILSKLSHQSNVIPISMDVTNLESIQQAYDQIQICTKTLDAIINFAGVSSFCSLIEENAICSVEKDLNINLLGMVRVNQIFFEMIHKGHGRIINCSSESGWMTPSPFAGPYVLSKHAVEAYNDSLRRELLYLNVPVIKIQPGSYDTNLTRQVSSRCDELGEHSKYYKSLIKK